MQWAFKVHETDTSTQLKFKLNANIIFDHCYYTMTLSSVLQRCIISKSKEYPSIVEVGVVCQ